MSERIGKVRRPPGLQAAGRRLWDGLLETYQFRPDELAMLTEMAYLVDDLVRLRRELKEAPLTVPGSKGQDTVHPLRVELHRTSARYEALTKTLGVPDPSADAALESSWAARRLARERWGG